MMWLLHAVARADDLTVNFGVHAGTSGGGTGARRQPAAGSYAPGEPRSGNGGGQRAAAAAAGAAAVCRAAGGLKSHF